MRRVSKRFGQLEAEPRRDEAERGRDRERDEELQRVVAIARVAKTRREAARNASPVDQHHGEDGAGLDHDVGEDIRAVAEPMFGNQEMSCTRDGQEFGDAFDHAEQDQIEQLTHVRSALRIRRKVAPRIGENLRRKTGVPPADICTVLVRLRTNIRTIIVQQTTKVSIQVIDNDHVYVRIRMAHRLLKLLHYNLFKDMRWPHTTSSS